METETIAAYKYLVNNGDPRRVVVPGQVLTLSEAFRNWGSTRSVMNRIKIYRSASEAYAINVAPESKTIEESIIAKTPKEKGSSASTVGGKDIISEKTETQNVVDGQESMDKTPGEQKRQAQLKEKE